MVRATESATPFVGSLHRVEVLRLVDLIDLRSRVGEVDVLVMGLSARHRLSSSAAAFEQSSDNGEWLATLGWLPSCSANVENRSAQVMLTVS
jgi:hypothetical protein